MRSSISSSEVRRRRNAPLANLAWFAATFALLAGATSACWVKWPHNAMRISRPSPDPSDFYLACSNNGSLEHMVLYHGLLGTTSCLHEADVLLLGHSRLMLGLTDRESLQILHRCLGNYYVMGFAGEADQFPLEIIRNYDLHPKLVIINADNFFCERRSANAEQAVKESLFAARKSLFEGMATYQVRSWLHRVLPHWLQLAENRDEFVIFRSRKDGVWYVDPGGSVSPDGLTYESNTFLLQEPDTWPHVPPAHLENARRFKEEMEARGARVVLMFVPYQGGCRGQAEEIASHLRVPLVSPKLNGLYSFDGGHLAKKSADRFAAAFVAELANTLKPQSVTSELSEPTHHQQ